MDLEGSSSSVEYALLDECLRMIFEASAATLRVFGEFSSDVVESMDSIDAFRIGDVDVLATAFCVGVAAGASGDSRRPLPGLV